MNSCLLTQRERERERNEYIEILTDMHKYTGNIYIGFQLRGPKNRKILVATHTPST